jgi:CHAD domain-containing protein
MTTEVHEMERKYEAGPGTVVPPMAGLPRVATESGEDEQVLEAEYYDTSDLRLMRAGITLRRRRGGDDAGWHLKLPADAGSRLELQLPLGQTGRRVPKELAALVRVHTRGEALRPVANITTARRRRVLLDGAGTSLAEVVADDVSAQTLGESTALSHWHEVEVELTGGDADLIKAADRALRQGGHRRAGHNAKLERALAGQLPASPPQPSISRRSPAGDVVLAYLQAQAGTLKALDPKVRRDMPDSVHQMRVAVRRLRGALRAFGKTVFREDTTWLTGELKWFGGVLGTARDAEVLDERLQTRLRQTPTELVIGPVQARVRGTFAPQEADARAAVLGALDSRRYFALLDGLDKLLADPPLTAKADAAAKDLLPAAVGRAYRRARRRMRRALRAPAGRGRDAALHQARKAIRRARYAAEAASPAAGKNATRFAGQMKKLQSLLGEHHDAVVSRTTLRDLGVRAHLAGENAFTYGLLHERDISDGARLAARAGRSWRKASRPRHVRWAR